MNQTREPLGRTLHDVLGSLVLLEQAGTPLLTLGARATGTVRRLGAGELQALREAAGAVSRAWRPAAEGEAFAWRGLEPKGNAVPTTVLAEAADALADLRAAAERRPFAGTTPEPRTAHDVRQAVRTLEAGLPDRDPATAGTGGALSDDFSGSLAQLAELFGMPKPETSEKAFGPLELADLASAANRPPA